MFTLFDKAGRRAGRSLVRVYQALQPWHGLGGHCRFQPSCSHYALEALDRHPLPRAIFLISKRLSRCHPWGAWGHDPVPDKEPRP